MSFIEMAQMGVMIGLGIIGVSFVIWLLSLAIEMLVEFTLESILLSICLFACALVLICLPFAVSGPQAS